MLELFCLLITLGLGLYCSYGPTYKESPESKKRRQEKEERERIKEELEQRPSLPDDYYGPKW